MTYWPASLFDTDAPYVMVLCTSQISLIKSRSKEAEQFKPQADSNEKQLWSSLSKWSTLISTVYNILAQMMPQGQWAPAVSVGGQDNWHDGHSYVIKTESGQKVKFNHFMK